jgi:hypothetical protein
MGLFSLVSLGSAQAGGESDGGVLAVLLLCVLPLFLLFVSIGLGVWVYRLRHKVRTLESEKRLLQTALESSKAKVSALEMGAQRQFRTAWLSAPPARFRNEIEVEVKFVYPLLKFLGFEDDDLSIREWVQVRVGRQIVKGEADWVVRRDGKPFLVVEAKEPGVTLDDAVQEQTRSYAFALKAPYYMVTNGKALRLYQLGVEEDEALVSCSVNGLAQCWQRLEFYLRGNAKA